MSNASTDEAAKAAAEKAAADKAAADKSRAKKSGRPTEGVVMVSCADERGRMRAGMRFGITPQRVDFSTLDREKIEAIVGDPQLIIRPATADDLAE